MPKYDSAYYDLNYIESTITRGKGASQATVHLICIKKYDFISTVMVFWTI